MVPSEPRAREQASDSKRTKEKEDTMVNKKKQQVYFLVSRNKLTSRREEREDELTKGREREKKKELAARVDSPFVSVSSLYRCVPVTCNTSSFGHTLDAEGGMSNVVVISQRRNYSTF